MFNSRIRPKRRAVKQNLNAFNSAARPAAGNSRRYFYARVDRDPLRRPLFPGKTLTCAIEEFAAFLVQFLGGPSQDAHRRWSLSLRESHLRFDIGREQRDAWMGHMAKALDDAQIEEPVRHALRGFFEHASAYVVNRETAPRVSQHPLHPQIAPLWDAQRALDQAVAAIRSGDFERAIALARTCAPPVFAGLLALMIANGHSALLDYAHQALTHDPALVPRAVRRPDPVARCFGRGQPAHCGVAFAPRRGT